MKKIIAKSSIALLLASTLAVGASRPAEAHSKTGRVVIGVAVVAAVVAIFHHHKHHPHASMTTTTSTSTGMAPATAQH